MSSRCRTTITGRSCWGSDASMLIRAFREGVPEDNFWPPHYGREGRRHGLGIDAFTLPQTLVPYLASMTPAERPGGVMPRRTLSGGASCVNLMLAIRDPAGPRQRDKGPPGDNEMGGHALLASGTDKTRAW